VWLPNWKGVRANSPSGSSAKSPRRYNIKVKSHRQISAVQAVTAVRRAGRLGSRRFGIESVFCPNVCFIVGPNEKTMLRTGDVHGSTERKYKVRKIGQLALMRGVIAVVILSCRAKIRASIFIFVETG
jgi:hypothetical protein